MAVKAGDGSMDNMRGDQRHAAGNNRAESISIAVDEQLMYVLSGHGRQRIGETECALEKGSVYHISTGMAHESVNEGDEPIVPSFWYRSRR
ncbi:MAG: cupin domain-containing protein [Lachnospiraceae bacterium]